MFGRMRCKFNPSGNKGLSPSVRCLIHNQVAQLSPTVEEVQPCLHKAQKKGQGPGILCHWPGIHRVPKLPEFCLTLCQRLVQLRLCPSLASFISAPGCALQPGLSLDPHSKTQGQPVLPAACHMGGTITTKFQNSTQLSCKWITS